jgi:hypothetical protein
MMKNYNNVVFNALLALSGWFWVIGYGDPETMLAIAPILGAALIGGGANILGGILGNAAQGRATASAQAIYERNVKDLEAIGIPSVEAMRLVMEDLKSQGQWTPELEASVNLGESQMGGITTDPLYREAQQKALSKLQEIGDSGGMLLEDRANLERTQGNIAADQRGAREAILQGAQQRGGYGSGTALAAQLMNQQAGATQAHQAGLDINAQAQKRALEAIQQGGNLAGSLRGQEFGEKERIAQAQDEIARWNAANQQAVRSSNTNLQNQAAQYNLNNAQRIADTNVQQRNAANQYNSQLYQQEFQNKMTKQGAIGNARNGQAQGELAKGQQEAAMWTGIGSGVGQAAGAYGQMKNTNEQNALNREAYGSTMRAQVMPATEKPMGNMDPEKLRRLA